MATVFVSEAVGPERLVGSAPQPDTGPRRHWRRLAALYRDSLVAAGRTVEPVLRPEIYQTGIAHRAVGAKPGAWHLAVKPIEHIRPFHCLPNVVVCDWPFAAFSSSSHGVSPFWNQVKLLGTADAVLCGTDLMAGHLRAAGLGRVVTLPPHIPAPAANVSRRAAHTVLVRADIDRLARMAPVLAGFATAHERRPGLRLVVHVGPRAPQPAETEALGPLAAHAAVSWTSGDAEPEASAALFATPSDGLPLALIDAMLAGLPLVAVADGAFRGAEDAVPIAAEPAEATVADTPLARHMRLTACVASADAIERALLAAADLDPAALARMAEHARAGAAQRFGLAAFETGLARLDAMLAGRHR